MNWLITNAIGALFTLARFSEAFLILRAADLGLSNDYLPLVLVVMNGAYGALAYPAGRLSVKRSSSVLCLADTVFEMLGRRRRARD